MFGLKIRDKCRILRSETKASPCGWSHWNAPILVTPVLSFWGWRIYSPLTPDSPPTMHSTGNPQSRLNWTWPMVRRDRTPTINGIRAAYCASIVAVTYAITSVASSGVRAPPRNGAMSIIIDPSARLGTTRHAGLVADSPIPQHALVCMLSGQASISCSILAHQKNVLCFKPRRNRRDPCRRSLKNRL